MRHRKKLILWMMVGAIVLCVAVPTLLIGLQFRQDNLDYALIQAVKRLDAPAVDHWLSLGANANALDTGIPPLTLTTLLKRLLERFQNQSHHVTGIDTDTNEATRLPALGLLMNDIRGFRGFDRESSADFDAMESTLIHHGADITLRGNIGESPLAHAVMRGFHSSVQALLSRQAEVNSKDHDGRTPLAGADAESAMMLLQHRANVNATDIYGTSVLVAALLDRRLQTAKLLIQHGANVNLADETGRSALGYAIAISKDDEDGEGIVRLLKQHGACLTAKDKEALARPREP